MRDRAGAAIRSHRRPPPLLAADHGAVRRSRAQDAAEPRYDRGSGDHPVELMKRYCLTLLLAVLVFGVAEPQSHAGTYSVTACFDAPAGQASAFTPTNSSPSTLTVAGVCPPTPGDPFSGLLLSTTLLAPNSPDGATAAWITA